MVRISRLFGFTCFPLKGQGGLASALKLHVEAFGIVLTGHEVPAKHLGGNTKRAAAIEWVDDDSTGRNGVINERSEEHTSELQSLMRISYAVFCLKKKKKKKTIICKKVKIKYTQKNA